jgi:DNA-binding transcriptional regulator/RsmH inhibitor MraZ
MFLSTFEKQLDAKRRIVVPQEFRTLASGSFDGVFCFPSIEADCLEGGGQALFDRYNGVIQELEVGDPLRGALETSILGGMAKLSFDTAGRITLPESLCDAFGLTEWALWSAWATGSRSGRATPSRPIAPPSATPPARGLPTCAPASAPPASSIRTSGVRRERASPRLRPAG